MKIGTKSALYGAHAFWLHPFFVFLAWWKLYGFPWDPRLWVAFFVHDLGYWGKPNMDGEEGERHPEWGARMMTSLFDHIYRLCPSPSDPRMPEYLWLGDWGRLVLYHSRFYAKLAGVKPSRFCFADKMAICLTPWWVYRWTAGLTGEIREYREDAANPSKGWANKQECSDREWYLDMQSYMRKWIEEFKDGKPDTWTREAA